MLTNSLNKDPTGDRRSIEKWKKVRSFLFGLFHPIYVLFILDNDKIQSL